MKNVIPVNKPFLILSCFLICFSLYSRAQIAGGPGQPVDTLASPTVILDTAVIPSWCAPFIECKAVDASPGNNDGKYIITIKCKRQAPLSDTIIRNDTFSNLPPGHYGITLVDGNGNPYPIPKCTQTIKRKPTPVPVDTVLARRSLQAGGELIIDKASPNPFTGQTQIYCYSPGAGDAVVSICNEMGVLEKRVNIKLSKGVNSFTVDGNNLSKGIHFVRIVSPGGTAATSLVHR